MPKRSKNSTDGAVFTYHERRKMDHGSIHRRLPGDAMKPWDRCALGLSRPEEPVITPHGVLFEREAILRDLLRQREEGRTAQAQVVEDHVREEGEEQRRKQAEERAFVERFEKSQSDVLPTIAPDSSEMKDETTRATAAADSNFWVPSIPARLPAPVEKHKSSKKKKNKISLKTRCPISKKPLRSKDLITLKLTPNLIGKTDTEAGKAEAAEKYMCPLCQSVLVNAVKPIALRTGTVLCSRCVAEFVVKEGKDPCTSDDIDVKNDVIPIFNVGTAFAASAADDPSSHEASVYRPSAT